MNYSPKLNIFASLIYCSPKPLSWPKVSCNKVVYFAVFDRDQGDPLLYKEIHEEFSSMIDALMEGFCDDNRIKPEQLVAALKHQDNSQKLSAKERVRFIDEFNLAISLTSVFNRPCRIYQNILGEGGGGSRGRGR